MRSCLQTAEHSAQQGPRTRRMVMYARIPAGFPADSIPGLALRTRCLAGPLHATFTHTSSAPQLEVAHLFPLHLCIHPIKHLLLLPSTGAQQTYKLKACFKCRIFGISIPVWPDVSLPVFLESYVCIEPCSHSPGWRHVLPSVWQVSLPQSRVQYPKKCIQERPPLPTSPHHLHVHTHTY